jgi:hypothetical protein
MNASKCLKPRTEGLKKLAQKFPDRIAELEGMFGRQHCSGGANKTDCFPVASSTGGRPVKMPSD